jgi:DMSO/TMAO reductase YedYZ molybdopterin-dependent catalytic subunit
MFCVSSRLIPAILCTILCIIPAAPTALAESGPILKITGAVESPLSLTLADLQKFQTVECQRNDVTSGKKFHGVFNFRGVPLRTLLETATIAKTDKNFKKPVDMAIVVRNPDARVALSWGEVFYRNPGEVFIAWTGTSILPHKSCKTCHPPDVFEPVMERYHRDLTYPRLILTGDQYTDRCLEGITEIEVVEFDWTDREKPSDPLYSPGFRIVGADLREIAFDDLAKDGLSPVQADLYTVGEGKGFHGIPFYTGFSFVDILKKAGVAPDLATVFRVSAQDNYRSVFSWGELFLNPDGKRMLLADQENGRPIEKGGRYYLVVPDDLLADRWVKAVQTIEKIQLK